MRYSISLGRLPLLKHLRTILAVLLVLLSTSLWADDSASSLDTNDLRDTRAGYLSLIEEWAPKYDLNVHLVEAIIMVESNYDRYAVSSKGCEGLMQLHPDTARRFGVTDSFDPEENIQGGIRYLNFLMGYFQGNLEHVLAAYNAGENAVVRYSGVPPYSETQKYVRKVTSAYHALNSAPAPVPPVQWPRGKFRLKRVIQPNGSVLFTNTE